MIAHSHIRSCAAAPQPVQSIASASRVGKFQCAFVRACPDFSGSSCGMSVRRSSCSVGGALASRATAAAHGAAAAVLAPSSAQQRHRSVFVYTAVNSGLTTAAGTTVNPDTLVAAHLPMVASDADAGATAITSSTATTSTATAATAAVANAAASHTATASDVTASAVMSNVAKAAAQAGQQVTIKFRPGLRPRASAVSTSAMPGEDLMAAADRCGADIPTGCLSGSCGICEVELFKFDKDGKAGSPIVLRACIAKVPRGYPRLEVDAVPEDAIWGQDGFDT